MGAFKIFRRFGELLDRETVDLPAVNNPLGDALEAKANSADLGTAAARDADQDLRTTDDVVFDSVIATGQSRLHAIVGDQSRKVAAHFFRTVLTSRRSNLFFLAQAVIQLIVSR